MLGVLSNTLFYNSPIYHNFYINGTSTMPILSIASGGVTFTGTTNGITKSMIGLSNVENTTDLSKPISDATTTALNLKSNLA